MIDTHSHIYSEEFDTDIKQVMERAVAAGVTHIHLPNIDLDSIDRLQKLHNQYPNNTSISMGLHPTSIDANYRETLDRIVAELNCGGYIAIGEIGIDLYWDKTFVKEQKIVFAEQLKIAYERELPVIIHCREALTEILEVFSSMRHEGLPRGVFHSFTGTVEQVRAIREYGDFYFGINGVVTFKKSTIPTILAEIGIDRLLLETDAPYLTPVPYRGKRNESSYVQYTAQKIADTLELPLATVIKETDKNAKNLFKI
ncbi:MAG: TatD family hydrolase [Bacteroidales bacterium]